MIVERTLKWLISILLIASMYAYAMFQGGFVSWFLFYSVVPLILYAFVIGFFPLKTIKVRRELHVERPVANERLKVTLIITKPAFPLFYLIVADQMSKKLQNSVSEARSKAIFFPLFKRNLTYSYEVGSLPRGEHQFYGVIIKTGDLFGFIQKQIEIAVEDSLVVYPKIESFDWKFMQMNTKVSHLYPDRMRQDLSEAAGVREYVPGDRLSWIDWKATAKRNQLVTKVFEQREVERTMLVFDDSRLSYQYRSPDLFEQVVSVAASLIAEMERKNISYLLPFVSEKNRNWLEALAKAEAAREVSFPEYVKTVIAQCSTKHLRLYLVSAHISKELAALLKQLARQHVQIHCFFIGAHDFDVRSMQSANVYVYMIPGWKGE